jgi:hypothetical protein
MKPEQVYEIIRKALEEGVSLNLWSLLLLVVLVLLGSFVGSYVRMKGKDLATKEDIEQITNKVESIKSEYAKQLELLVQEHRVIYQGQERKYQLSVAALDKRLAAHQEAYSLWWELMGSASKRETVGDAVLRCQDWWVHNSLYLSTEAREAFRHAYHAASLHPELLAAHVDGKEIRENWETIREAGDTIVKAVALPNWSEEEYQPVEGQKNKAG